MLNNIILLFMGVKSRSRIPVGCTIVVQEASYMVLNVLIEISLSFQRSRQALDKQNY